MRHCATPGQLERFLHDQLDGPERQTVATHVEECAACQQVLEQIKSGPDAYGQSDRNQAEPQLEGSVREAKKDDSRVSPSTPSCPVIEGFRIIREIGRGGMGVVYLAQEENLNRLVALKFLPLSALVHPKHVQRFEREAKAAARLHHTNIVPVFGVGEYKDNHYYVMQFIEGSGLDVVLVELCRLRQAGPNPVQVAGQQSLSSVSRLEPNHDRVVSADLKMSSASIARSLASGRFADPGLMHLDPDEMENQQSETAILRPPKVATGSGAVDASSLLLPGSSKVSSYSELNQPYFRSVARIGLQVAEALEYANRQGVLHRDIKPSNLLLDNKGIVWVTDFGLAKTADAHDLTETGDILGTVRYMAPERFEGKCDVRSDVYGLGVTLYELVALRPAYEGKDRHELIERVMHEEAKPLKGWPRRYRAIWKRLSTRRSPTSRFGGTRRLRALAADLQRFLEGRPILARRVSTAERFGRWCRRNPWVASLSAASFAILVAGTLVSSILAFRAMRAEQASRLSESEARAVLEFFSKKVLVWRGPRIKKGAWASTSPFAPRWTRPSPRSNNLLPTSPLWKRKSATRWGRLICTWPRRRQRSASSSGRWRCSSNSWAATTSTRWERSATSPWANQDAGRPAEALPLFAETLKAYKAKLGSDHRLTLASLDYLAMAYLDAGRFAEAISLEKEGAGPAQGQVRPRSPRHADRDERPRLGVPGRRPARRRNRPTQGIAEAADSHVGSRSP